jgi:DNA topoisomerase-3
MATAKPAETRLPDLEDGEMAEIVALTVVEKTTRAPAHYTEASLLEDMVSAGKFIENDPALRKALKVVSGLGTSATRAATFEGLKHDKYIEKSGKHIKALPKGIALIQWLEGVAPELTNVAVTARWEADLAVVAETGGGAAFEARIVEMVKDLIAKLKLAPAMSLASPSKTPSKETSRMSENNGERSSAPTPKMLEYASNIAAKMGTSLPENVAASFEACKEFIDANKEAAMRPSEKQLKFATSIAERKGLAIPTETLANGKELSAWIDANK